MGGSQSKQQLEEVTKPSVPTPPVSTSETTPTIDPESAEGSKCPMHQSDGSYNWDWKQLFKAAQIHGSQGRKPLSKEQQEQARKPQSSSAAAGGGCPVQHDTPPPQPQSGCPVHPEYNVYSEPIDKTNQMPKGVKTQLPVATQQTELSTNRVSSSIPKGGGEDAASNTWTYPSPQQFYNALTRKGKLGDDTDEEDMESVVALHNNMNEKTWAQVVEWERKTYDESSTPKLLKFQGRPTDLSPKAMLKHYLLGHPLPFDRHDWTVLRNDGMTVRYVIDYYYDETRGENMAEDEKLPELHDRNASPTLLIDVRPALDGPDQLFARAVQMPYKIWNKQTTFFPLPLKGTPDMASQVQESINVWKMIQESSKPSSQEEEKEEAMMMDISQSEAKEIAQSFAKVLNTCAAAQKKIASCKSEEECMKASMDLTMCMGPELCPVQYKTLRKTMEEDDDLRIEAALSTLSECVVFQDGKRHLAKEQHPSVF
jgi:cytochrome c heme-lyase